MEKNTKVTNVIIRCIIICLSVVVSNKRFNLSKRATILYGQGLPLTKFSVLDWLGSFILQLWIPISSLQRFYLLYFSLTSNNKLIAMVLIASCAVRVEITSVYQIEHSCHISLRQISLHFPCNERNALLLVLLNLLFAFGLPVTDSRC